MTETTEQPIPLDDHRILGDEYGEDGVRLSGFVEGLGYFGCSGGARFQVVVTVEDSPAVEAGDGGGSVPAETHVEGDLAASNARYLDHAYAVEDGVRVCPFTEADEQRPAPEPIPELRVTQHLADVDGKVIGYVFSDGTRSFR